MWGVDASEVYARDHRLYHTGSGESFDFGEVVETAANVETMESVPLKDPSQWPLHRQGHAGGRQFRHDHRRRHLRPPDVSIPGMKIAVVARCPV